MNAKLVGFCTYIKSIIEKPGKKDLRRFWITSEDNLPNHKESELVMDLGQKYLTRVR